MDVGLGNDHVPWVEHGHRAPKCCLRSKIRTSFFHVSETKVWPQQADVRYSNKQHRWEGQVVGPACGCYAVQCFNMSVFLSTLMFRTCGIGDLYCTHALWVASVAAGCANGGRAESAAQEVQPVRH